MADLSKMAPRMTIGLDIGDTYCQVCALDARGEIVEEGSVRTNPEALRQRFGSGTPMRIALEVGTTPGGYRPPHRHPEIHTETGHKSG
jgi:hypothetical protein